MDIRRRSARRISAAAVLKMPPPPFAAFCTRAIMRHALPRHFPDHNSQGQAQLRLLGGKQALEVGVMVERSGATNCKWDFMPTCSLSAAVLGRTPVNLPVSSRTGTVPLLFMFILRPRPRGTAPALTGRLQQHFRDPYHPFR